MKKQIKSIARITGLSAARKHWQDRQRRKRVERAKANPISRAQLERDLKTLGLASGATVMAHSALSKLGFIEGGPDTVIDALLSVIGERGTLVMPAYAIGDFRIQALKEEKVFDPAADPSLMGKITEIFRLRPGVLRSSHYTHSCCGIGPQAEFMLLEHEQSVTPAGLGSPCRRLIDTDGFILAMGSSFGAITFYHVIEDMMESFPIPVYYPEMMRGPVRGADGQIRMTEYRVHDPAQYLGKRIDLNKNKEAEILGLFRSRGIVREGPIGDGHGYLYSAKEAAAYLTELAESGITIY